jgi:hypothetical protein
MPPAEVRACCRLESLGPSSDSRVGSAEVRCSIADIRQGLLRVVSTHPDDRRDRQRTELRFFPKFGIELIIGHGDAELAVHVAH